VIERNQEDDEAIGQIQTGVVLVYHNVWSSRRD